MGGGLMGNKKTSLADYANTAGYGATTPTEIQMKRQEVMNQMMQNQMSAMQAPSPYVSTGTVSSAKPAPSEPQFKVVKIRNGYLLHHAPTPWADMEMDYCADMNEVGQRVTALLVQYLIQEEK